MTPSELKAKVEAYGTSPYFFTYHNMRFFGDTMRNYGTRRDRIIDTTGTPRDVWELWRKRPVGPGKLTSSAYFDCETFAIVRPQT